MKKFLVFFLMVLLMGCQPNSINTATMQPLLPSDTPIPPTATLVTLPTSTPVVEASEYPGSELTHTPAPTATPKIELIQSGNLDKLGLVEIVPLQAKILGKKNAPWKIARWTPNNAYLIVETNLGIDVLDGGNLEFLRSYPDIQPLGFVGANELLGRIDAELVRINFQTGELTHFNTADFTLPAGLPVMAASEDGDWIAYPTGPNSVDVVEINSGAANTLLFERKVAIEEITRLRFGLDGGLLYVSCIDHMKKSLTFGMDLATRESAFEIQSNGIIALSPEGTYFAYEDLSKQHTFGFTTRQRDGLIQSQFSTMAGGAYSGIHSYSYRVVDLEYLMDGRYLAVLYSGFQNQDDKLEPYSDYQAIFIWDVLTGQAIETFNEIGVLPQVIRIAPDGLRFMLAAPDGMLKIYDLEDGALLAETLAYDTSASRVFSPDGSKLALINGGEVLILDTESLQLVSSYSLDESTPAEIDLRFIGEEQLGISVISANHFRSEERQWGVKAYTKIISVDEGMGVLTLNGAANCRYSPDSRLAACEHVGSFLNEVTSLKVFDLRNGNVLQNFNWSGDGYFAFEPLDDKLVHCITNDNLYSITDISNDSLSYYHYPCEPFAFDPTGTEILFSDGSVIRKMTDEVIRTLVLPMGINRQQAPHFYFEPDGDFVVMNNGAFSFAEGGAATIFDGVGEVYSATLSADGMTLLLLTDRGLEYWQVRE